MMVSGSLAFGGTKILKSYPLSKNTALNYPDTWNMYVCNGKSDSVQFLDVYVCSELSESSRRISDK